MDDDLNVELLHTYQVTMTTQRSTTMIPPTTAPKGKSGSVPKQKQLLTLSASFHINKAEPHWNLLLVTGPHIYKFNKLQIGGISEMNHGIKCVG